MDRISNLPEPLREKILFSLPSKDAIRMSFSSRHWQSFWNSVWNSIPVSSYVFENESYRRMPRKKFVKRVDNVLRRNLPVQYEDQKKIVRFKLAITTLSKKMKDSDVVDRWIKMVTINYVRALKLEIEISPKIRYRFPPAAFDVGVLVVLDLMYCTLEKTLFIQEHTVFIRLKKLIFDHVDFNGVVAGELLSRCPLLETLKLISCGNIKHVELCDFLNLKNVELRNDDDEDIFTYKINSPNLKSLIYCEDGKPMDLAAVSSNNLKKLYIVTHGSTITDQYIKEVCSKFPLLEDLCLNAGGSFGSDVGEIRISGHHLKSLIVCGTMDQHMILNLDAPNLVRFQREDEKIIPPTFLMNCVKVELINFIVYGVDLNSAWFFKLRDYLGKFTAFDHLHFRIYIRPCRMVKFSFDELQAEKLVPVPRVRKLVLNSRSVVPSRRDFTAFINGLFWTCHPLTISVESDRAPNRKFMKFLSVTLLARDEHPLCCRACNIKCWRHNLLSVKLKKCSDFEDKRAYDDDDEEAEEHEESAKVFKIYDYHKDHDQEEEDEEEEEEDGDEDEEGEGEGMEVGDGEGEGEGEGENGDGEEEEEDDDGDDDPELLETLRVLEKYYVFELQWSTSEDGGDGEIVGLELVL